MILCTLNQFKGALDFNDDDLIINDIIDYSVEDNTSNAFRFFHLVGAEHICVQHSIENRIKSLMSQSSKAIDLE